MTQSRGKHWIKLIDQCIKWNWNCKKSLQQLKPITPLQHAEQFPFRQPFMWELISVSRCCPVCPELIQNHIWYCTIFNSMKAFTLDPHSNKDKCSKLCCRTGSSHMNRHWLMIKHDMYLYIHLSVYFITNSMWAQWKWNEIKLDIFFACFVYSVVFPSGAWNRAPAQVQRTHERWELQQQRCSRLSSLSVQPRHAVSVGGRLSRRSWLILWLRSIWQVGSISFCLYFLFNLPLL